MRETTRDTEAIAQYKTMRETLVYLTHLNNEDTETIMLEKLSKQVEVCACVVSAVPGYVLLDVLSSNECGQFQATPVEADVLTYI